MSDKTARFESRWNRYIAAMRGTGPDMVPIRPFAAEVSAVYAGYTCQQVTHDYRYAFEAMYQMCRDFDWDATVPNMVYVWTGLTQTLGTRYYGVPGIDIPPNVGFQYREPSMADAFMKETEYDDFIADPAAFLANVWYPRISRYAVAPGEPNTLRNNISLISGAVAMQNYFNAYGPHCRRLAEETGTPGAICGILKAPFDLIADKFRGYTGLCMDMFQRPEKVEALAEALAPHLLYMARATADPSKQLPVGLWLHRGCVPFISPTQFERFFWPSLEYVITELWKDGIQTLMYAEGNWDLNLAHVARLPENSVVYHVDRGDIFSVKKAFGERFCLSGGVPNDLLALGSPEEVREQVRRVIEGVGRSGRYIVDASAIMQNDTKIENLRAMSEAAREFGGLS